VVYKAYEQDATAGTINLLKADVRRVCTTLLSSANLQAQ
jgi:hypothetical protein